jgi:uncharacterized protein
MIENEKPTAIFEVTQSRKNAAHVSSFKKGEKRAQSPFSDTWVPSRFNVSVDLPENRKAVYNTYTAAIVILTPKMWGNTLQANSAHHVSEEPVPEFLRLLHSKGFLVSRDVDEVEFIRLHYLSSRHGNGALGVNLLTTLDCNLKCPYCFEGGVQAIHKGMSMTRETEEATVRYIDKSATGKKDVHINWFGGEPLLDIEAIMRMSSQLIPAFDKAGIKHNAVLITNGTLLSQAVVDRLCECKVSTAQVTVDIPKATKRDKRGLDTLEDVLDKVSAAADKLKVFVRINLTQDDEIEFDQLYQGLIRRNLQKRLKSINIAHVFVPENGRSGCSLSRFPYQSYVEVERRERTKAKVLGIPMSTYLPSATLSTCAATCDSSMSIGPDGLLYKCVEDVGWVERAYGSVFREKDLMFKNLLPWLTYDWFQYEMCRECPVLPQCAGGCAHKRLYQAHSLKDEDFCYWNIRGDLENRIREVALAGTGA